MNCECFSYRRSRTPSSRTAFTVDIIILLRGKGLPMAVLDQGKVDRIKHLLKMHPKGLTISDLSSKTKMNRNLMAKYLDMLLISGQVEMNTIGSAKVFHLSHLIPISAMLEFSSDLVIMLDDQQRILQVNEPVLALLSTQKENLLGKSVVEIDNPLFKVLSMEGKESGTGVTETRCTLQDEEHVFHMKRVPTAFEDGSQGTTLILEDITPRKKYQEMLEKQEARYRQIVEDQPELICRFTPDFSLTFANPAFIRYHLLPHETIGGKNFLTFVYPGDIGTVRESIRSLSPENPFSRCQVRAVYPSEGMDPEVRWQDWTYLARFGTDGSIAEIQGTGRDITGERKQAEEKETELARVNTLTRQQSEHQVQECERQYRTLIQYLNMGMYRSTADPQGRFLWGNTSFINILGYDSMNELQGITVIEIFAQPETRKEILQELKRKGYVKNKIVHLKRKDQSPVVVSVTAVAEVNGKGDILSINGVVQEIPTVVPKKE
jgi:PAS domain S-box-containing protein